MKKKLAIKYLIIIIFGYFLTNFKIWSILLLNLFWDFKLGVSRLKRLLIEDLSRTFDTHNLELFIRSIDRNLDLYELTGFTPKTTIPRKDAAKVVVDYFFETKNFVKLINFIIYTSLNDFRGEKVIFNGLKFILKEVEELGYQYSPNFKKIVIMEKTKVKRNDWGFLEECKIYNFCFVSIDISGNSKLVRKYDNALIKDTYNTFKKMVTATVESRKGRIWSWEGDGGLLVFHLEDFVNNAILTAIDIMTSMIVFNATSNLLNEDVHIRIGINAGTAEYKTQTSSITSDSLEEAKNIEKRHTEIDTISISKHTVLHLNTTIRNYLTEKNLNGVSIYQLKIPFRRKQID